MNGGEKVLSVIIAILVVLCVVMGYQLSQTNKEIGEKEQYLNDLHNQKVEAYENEIDRHKKVITTLQLEKEQLEKLKQRVKVVTIREIDSITRLPFDGKAEFWTTEIARLDSLRKRYVGWNNEKGL